MTIQVNASPPSAATEAMVSTPTMVQMRKKRMSKRPKCRLSFPASIEAGEATVSPISTVIAGGYLSAGPLSRARGLLDCPPVGFGVGFARVSVGFRITRGRNPHRAGTRSPGWVSGVQRLPWMYPTPLWGTSPGTPGPAMHYLRSTRTDISRDPYQQTRACKFQLRLC